MIDWSVISDRRTRQGYELQCEVCEQWSSGLFIREKDGKLVCKKCLQVSKKVKQATEEDRAQ